MSLHDLHPDAGNLELLEENGQRRVEQHKPDSVRQGRVRRLPLGGRGGGRRAEEVSLQPLTGAGDGHSGCKSQAQHI